MAALEQALAKLDAAAESGTRFHPRGAALFHSEAKALRVEVERLVEDLEEERAVSRGRFVEVERLQHQLEEARKPITVQATGGVLFEGMRSRAESAEATVAQLRQALEACPCIHYSGKGNDCISRANAGLPSLIGLCKRCAVLAGSVPATDTDSEPPDLLAAQDRQGAS